MINPYLTGNKVYRGGSPNATTGTVDPTGYVERERRSGLAKKMLQNVAGQNVQKEQARTALANIQVPGAEYRNPIGNIVPPEFAATTLPQDVGYQESVEQAYRDWASLAQQLTANRQQAELDYTKSISPYEEQVSKVPTDLANKLAARGLSSSSAFNQTAADTLRNVQEGRGQIIGQYNEADTAYDTGRIAGEAAFRAAMNSAEKALARRLIPNAGALGIGELGEVTDPGSAMSDAVRKQIQEILAARGLTPGGTPKPPAAPPKTNPIYKPPATAPKPPISTPVTPTSKPPMIGGTYRYGANGSGVKAIQEMLNRYGAKLNVDGAFGNKTLAAVKLFQKNHGLTQDGIVGPRTLAALWK